VWATESEKNGLVQKQADSGNTSLSTVETIAEVQHRALKMRLASAQAAGSSEGATGGLGRRKKKTEP